MLTQRVFSALVLLVLTVCCSADTLTPLIAWSNGDVLTSSQPSTVHELLLHSNLALVNVAVVFKASKLTFDELAKFSGAYGEKNAALSSLQAELQSSSSTLWSGLSGQPASTLLNSLAFTMDTSPRYVKDGDDLSLDKESLTLLVVRLPGGESEVGFALQGEVITQIMSNLRSSNPDATFLAFYTSDPNMNNFAYSSDYDSDEFYDEIDNGATVLKVHRSRQARQSGGGGKAKVETGDTLCAELSKDETTCVALCLTDNMTRVEVTIENRMKKDGLAERLTNFRFTEGNCDFNHTMYNGPFLKARANVNSTTEEVTLIFVFPQCIQCPLRETFNISTQRPQDNVNRIAILRKGFWRMDLYVEETPGDEKMYLRSTEGPRIFSQFEVPVGVSYACGKNKLNHYEDSNTSEIEGQTTMQYRFNGIQAQINVKHDSKGQHFFASAYNCQGYFSNTTWMGIFAVIIIIFFIYVANVFAFSVETIDRFDDPRGPTITVENLH